MTRENAIWYEMSGPAFAKPRKGAIARGRDEFGGRTGNYGVITDIFKYDGTGNARWVSQIQWRWGGVPAFGGMEIVQQRHDTVENFRSEQHRSKVTLSIPTAKSAVVLLLEPYGALVRVKSDFACSKWFHVKLIDGGVAISVFEQDGACKACQPIWLKHLTRRGETICFNALTIDVKIRTERGCRKTHILASRGDSFLQNTVCHRGHRTNVVDTSNLRVLG